MKQHNLKKFSLILFALVGFTMFLTSCGDDEPEETKTRIFGTITIDNVTTWDTWQDSGEVQLTIFPEFSLDPLAGWGAIPDGFFGPTFIGGTYAAGAPYNSQNPLVAEYSPGTNSLSYDIELEPGTYSALALGFRHDNVADPSLKTATLGVHWNTPSQVSHGVVIKVQAGPSVITVFDYPAPAAFTIAEGEELEINFKADFNFVNQWYR